MREKKDAPAKGDRLGLYRHKAAEGLSPPETLNGPQMAHVVKYSHMLRRLRSVTKHGPVV